MKSILFIIFLTLIGNIQAQMRGMRVNYRGEILRILEPTIGDSSSVIGVIDIDRVLADESFQGMFEDPYGTLKNCAIFVISPESGEIIHDKPGAYWFGVYKDGNVIWLSDSLYSETPLENWFYVTRDLNRDGKVDIVLELSGFEWVGGNKFDSYLYVISWDGNTGKFINDGGLHSKVKVYNGVFSLFDLNGDGIMELTSDTYTYNKNTGEYDSSRVVCCWNGEKYGFWEECPKWPGPNINPYYPYTKANDFSVKLSTEVIKSRDKYEYRINVKNSEESKQYIKQFFFKYYADSLIWLRPNDWGGTIGVESKYFGFTAIEDSQKIIPGTEETFGFRHKGLPKISDCRLLSSYEKLGYSIGADNYEYYRDRNILNNSVKKKILAPCEPPNPFIHADFIDTLTTYTDSSYSLGWIKNEQTKNKYNNYFTTAKTNLEQGDSSAARNEVEKVLTDCNTDSSSVLTSEAYALLYFNTEYLVNRLPEAQESKDFRGKQKGGKSKKTK